MENTGIELGLNFEPVRSENFNWNLGFNFTWADTEITKLQNDLNFIEVTDRNIGGGTGVGNQIHAVGERPFSFYVYEQVYDDNGRPIQGVYVDQNNDGVINTDDKRVYKSAVPDIYTGLTTNFNYKNWDLTAVLRGQFGGYVYNNIDSQYGNRDYAFNTQGNYLLNIVDNYFESGMTSRTDDSVYSDYYVQNADFVRLDNVVLGYRFPENFLGSKVGLRLYGSVNNVFTITGYDGLDPEIQNGNDNNIYPRPRTYLFGINLDF